MKKQLLLAACLLAAFSPIFSQEKSAAAPLGREIVLGLGGLDLDNFNWFQLTFKKQKSPERFSRFRINGHFDGAFDQAHSSLAVLVNAASGEETRRSINDRLFFVRGYEVWAGLGLNATEGDDWSGSVSPGGGVVLGLQYRLGERFYLGLEAVPGVRLDVNYSSPAERVSIAIGGRVESAGALHFGIRF